LSPPRVSVCVPTCNGGAYVSEALASILGQAFQDYELLVVDDASTDDTLEIVGACTDPRLCVYRNASRLGIPANWNECLRRARGEYVKFLFQDDVLFPRAIDSLVGALDRFPDAPLAFGRRDVSLESGPDVFAKRDAEAMERLYRGLVDEAIQASDVVEAGLTQGRDLTLNVVGEPSFVLLRREVALRAGGFDGVFAQLADWEFWLRLLRTGRFAFVTESLGRLRVHQGSQSATRFRTRAVRWELVRLLARVRALYGAELSPEARRSLSRCQWRHGARLVVAEVLRV
jgi:glycosyltransferase involved in cell wall biosynthesis